MPTSAETVLIWGFGTSVYHALPEKLLGHHNENE
jgi:hypothetical protein